MVKRLFRCVVIVSLSVLCTGCWDSTEIDRLAIVTGSGIDLVTQENGPDSVLSTLQIARASELGSNGGGAPETSTGSTDSFLLEDAEGSDALAALEVIRQRLSRKLFMGQRRVIVIGEDYAKKGMYDIVDEIIRNPQSRLRTYVVVAYHDKASTILKLPYPLNRLPSDAIAEIEQQGSLPDVDAKQFIQRMMSNGDTFAMGIEKVSSPMEGSGSSNETFALEHLALFHDGKLVGWLDGREFQGFLWLHGRVKRDDTTVEVPGVPGHITARMLGIRTVRKVMIVQGKPKIMIQVKTEYDIAENGTTLDLNNPANVMRVRSIIRDELTSQMQETMDALQHKYHVDPLGFADELNKRHPHIWKQLSREWGVVYSQTPIAIVTEVNIRNSGLTGPSIRSTLPSKDKAGSEGGRN